MPQQCNTLDKLEDPQGPQKQMRYLHRNQNQSKLHITKTIRVPRISKFPPATHAIFACLKHMAFTQNQQ